ncbi:sensor histidine kinase [Anaeromicropila populeti]|uniref:Histidine kinase-, DNA gyrase B-, and HSP90-like ATPase n=1 Tax=Anaeromicropila populeti TaxID=37658 RepID=A0A1I6LFJ9_9FIRM|nr:histidine kinase [Anaeromicropila populeti]SFS02070.1 Histidine kinase-, DNA gyrase B-, and HSP90-like ATPase [Anaeromicropila populeti]
MQKKKSFIKEMLLYLMILTGQLILILVYFCFSSYTILQKEIKDASGALLNIYINEVNNGIIEMNGVLVSITTRQEELGNIRSNSENKRNLSAISLQNYMKNLMAGNHIADVIVVYDEKYNICLDAIKTGFNFEKKNSLRDFTSRAVSNQAIDNYQWNFLKIDNDVYLYKMFLKDNRAIAIYTKASNILNAISGEMKGNRSIILTNNEGDIGYVWGKQTRSIVNGGNISNISTDNYFQISKSIVEEQIKIYCFTAKKSIFQQTHTSMLGVAAAAGLSVFFMFFILHYAKQEIAAPMRLIISNMEKIKSGNYSSCISKNFSKKEFELLQETIEKMVDEIVELKIQAYEKRIAFQEMELKSIRLQLKPHFFLNALTTISSLNSQNSKDQIAVFIDALSKNIRYMFRTGFHTVTIKDEIRHVHNYFEMQELKYPQCVLYIIDLPKELEEWRLPQMIIHTFIENEYKYAVSMDKTLLVLIKISMQNYKGTNMLLIEIEDDGKGYPQEVLEYMNHSNREDSGTETRIGLWSVKRMMELMYNRDDLILLENVYPHGCLNKIYIPEKENYKMNTDH